MACIIHHCGCHETPGRVFAWCPLHRAAPELLIALKDMVEALTMENPLAYPTTLTDAQRAIQKAEGR